MATDNTYPYGGSWWSAYTTQTTIPTNTSHIAGSAGEVMSRAIHRAIHERGLLMSMKGDEGSMMPVIFKSELKDQPGDFIHMYFASKIVEQPSDQGKIMWRNGTKIRLYQDSVGLGVIKKNIGIDLPMSGQRSIHNLVKLRFNALSTWFDDYGPELMLISRLTGETYYDAADIEIGGWVGSASGGSSSYTGIGPDSNPTLTTNFNYYYGNDATSEATIDASDILTPGDIWKLVESCRMGIIGANHAGGTVKTMRKFHPIPIMGGMYVGIFHPYQIGDLKYAAGSEWIDFQKFANLRGNDNPLFTGTGNLAGQAPTPIGMLYGMLIYDYVRMPVHTDWGEGSNVLGCSGLVLGGEAIAYAEGFGPEWTTEIGRHKEESEIAVKLIAGAKVLEWNDIINGSIVVKTAGKIHS